LFPLSYLFKTFNPYPTHPSGGLYGLPPLFSPFAHLPSILFPKPLNKSLFKFNKLINNSLFNSGAILGLILS
jgi:hypothetical protein